MSDQDQKPTDGDGTQPDGFEGSRSAETIVRSSGEATDSATQQIGHFHILNVLGQGAFGAVYHARDPVLEREVAIKVPHASRIETDEMRQRFLREARAAAGLRHPHICPVYEVGEENDVPYIVMAFINGQELTSVLRRRGQFTDRQAALLVRRLALALEFAHQQGIVHRDLKPDNIMMDRERKEPVIMDFGLARRESGKESQLTQEGQLMGTPVYMPPEQARGDVDRIGPASDIYSLGVILYELLCGRRPHEGSMAEVFTQLLTSAPAPPSQHRADIAPELEAICMKAIARDVDDRYSSMLEFATEVEGFLKSDDAAAMASVPDTDVPPAVRQVTESAAHAITVIQPIPREVVVPLRRLSVRHFKNRNGWPWYALAAVVLVAGLASIMFWSSDSGVDAVSPTGEFLVRVFIGKPALLTAVRFSPDNQWIAAQTRGNVLQVWHRDDSKPLDRDWPANLRLQAFTNDSRALIAKVKASILQIEILTGLQTDPLKPEESESQPSGKKKKKGAMPVRTSACVTRSGILYWTRPFKKKFLISRRDSTPGSVEIRVPEMAFHDWGLLPESQSFLALEQTTGELHFWALDDALFEANRLNSGIGEDAVLILGKHDSEATCLAWSQDERVAATAAVDGSVILWDLQSHGVLPPLDLDPHPSTVHALALSPDGKYLLTGCGIVDSRASNAVSQKNDFSIRLWNVETGSLIAVVGAHRSSVTDLSFGGDSSEAVSASADNTVCLWTLPTADYAE